MTRWRWALAVLALGSGCTESAKKPLPPRAEIRSLGGSTVEIIPAAEQLPYCLVYTLSERGVLRQLTMTPENRSIPCEPGQPIANTRFRIPADEGKVKAVIVFSDQLINAGSVAEQLQDLKDRERITALDMRLPGRAFVETLEFQPTADTGETASSTGEENAPPSEATGPEGHLPVERDAPAAAEALE